MMLMNGFIIRSCAACPAARHRHSHPAGAINTMPSLA
jgi:hypothetical protein